MSGADRPKNAFLVIFFAPKAMLRWRAALDQISVPRINRVYFSILSGKDSIAVVVVTRIDWVYFF